MYRDSERSSIIQKSFIPNKAGSPPTILCILTSLYPQLGGYKGPYVVVVISLRPRSPSKPLSVPLFPPLLSNGQQTKGSLPSKPQTEARRKLFTCGSSGFDFRRLSNNVHDLILMHTPGCPLGF